MCGKTQLGPEADGRHPMMGTALARLTAAVVLAAALAATAATAARAPFKGKVCALATAKQVTAIPGVSSRCVNGAPEPAPGATIYVGNWAGKTPTSPRLQVSVQVYKDAGMLRVAKSNLDQGLPGPPKKITGIGSGAYEATGGGSTAIRFAAGGYVATAILSTTGRRSRSALERFAKTLAKRLA